jgi:threonine dehydrogenase-like Zn-dependent dehydrogenase
MAAKNIVPAQLLTHKFHLNDMRDAISTILDRSRTGVIKALMLP